MAVDKLVDSTQLDSDLTSVANAIRAKSGGSGQLAFPAGFVSEIGNISGGGGSISDGVEILGRNSTGSATKARLYGSGPVYAYQFACGNSNGRQSIGPWQAIKEIEVAYKPTSIEAFAFVGLTTLTSFSCDTSEVLSLEQYAFRLVTGIGAMTFPKVTTIESNVFSFSGITSASFPVFNRLIPNGMFNGCTRLASVIFPMATKIGVVTSNVFKDCKALATAEFGSVGYPITEIRPDAFSGCTQSGLTITVYAKGANVDAIVSNIRNGATNATIIIKASENTTYGGTSYNAGDTILTSTP